MHHWIVSQEKPQCTTTYIQLYCSASHLKPFNLYLSSTFFQCGGIISESYLHILDTYFILHIYSILMYSHIFWSSWLLAIQMSSTKTFWKLHNHFEEHFNVHLYNLWSGARPKRQNIHGWHSFSYSRLFFYKIIENDQIYLTGDLFLAGI